MRIRFSPVLFPLSAVVFILLTFLLTDVGYMYAGMMKEEAQAYRIKGYECQEKGDIDSAISCYQKAASLDIDYAAPHNDLGILFEAKGWLDRAKEEYQKALAIDPNYEKAHTNLALLYERKGELEKAAFHWMRRYKLGKPNDPWTYEAKQRLEKLGLLDELEEMAITAPPAIKEAEPLMEKDRGLSEQEEADKGWTRIKKGEGTEKKAKEPPVKKKIKSETKEPPVKPADKVRKKAKPRKKEKASSAGNTALDRELQESLKLAEERLKKGQGRKRVSSNNTERRTPIQENSRQKPSSPGARTYYSKAQDYFNKGEYARALDTIREAKKDYPEDTDLLELEKSVKHKMKEERIEDHYNEGIMNYRQNDYPGARKEFEAILNILPE